MVSSEKLSVSGLSSEMGWRCWIHRQCEHGEYDGQETDCDGVLCFWTKTMSFVPKPSAGDDGPLVSRKYCRIVSG